jgi:hypothetical protein
MDPPKRWVRWTFGLVLRSKELFLNISSSMISEMVAQ